MVTFSEGLKVFSFSVMQSSFCFPNVNIVTVPAASFVDDLRSLRTVEAVFVRKEGFDAAFVLKNDLEVDEKSRSRIHRI